jgi:hypothetical protein
MEQAELNAGEPSTMGLSFENQTFRYDDGFTKKAQKYL